MHEIHAKGSALTAMAACLGPRSLGFVWKVIWKDVQKVIWLSGLISISRFYYYRLGQKPLAILLW